MSIATRSLAEIVERYVTGTAPRGAWFVNYETFPAGARDLEASYPDRGVRIVSKFRPDNVPTDFDSSLLGVLRSKIQTSVAHPYVAVMLEWRQPPEDLDLHAWLERDGAHAHVFFRSRGSLNDFPDAALDQDERNGGTERIIVSTRDLDRLVIAVHRFSSLGPIGSAHPLIRLVALDRQQQRKQILGTRTISGENAAAWWHVLEMDGTGEIRWVDGLGPEPPLRPW